MNKKTGFRLFMVAIVALTVVGIVTSYTTSAPWVGETAVSWKFLAFELAVWGVTEYVAKRQGAW